MREKILILMSSIRKNMEVIDGPFEELKKVYKDYEKTGDHYFRGKLHLILTISNRSGIFSDMRITQR